MASRERPLSPHLQIYKPQMTSVLSITHRTSGVVLAVGSLLLVYWLVAVAAGSASHGDAQAFFGSWLGRLLLFGFSLALFYHLSNGIRHLFWDAGYGFELETVQASGWAVIVASVALTLVAWIWGYAAMGA